MAGKGFNSLFIALLLDHVCQPLNDGNHMQWTQYFRYRCKWLGGMPAEIRRIWIPQPSVTRQPLCFSNQTQTLGGHLPIFRRHHHCENHPGARCRGKPCRDGPCWWWWLAMRILSTNKAPVNSWTSGWSMLKYVEVCWRIVSPATGMILGALCLPAGAGDYSAIRWLDFGPATLGSKGPLCVVAWNWRSVWLLTLAGRNLKTIYNGDYQSLTGDDQCQ